MFNTSQSNTEDGLAHPLVNEDDRDGNLDVVADDAVHFAISEMNFVHVTAGKMQTSRARSSQNKLLY